MPGIVSLDPASERTKLRVRFNANQTSLEAIANQLDEWGDEVTDWERLEWEHPWTGTIWKYYLGKDIPQPDRYAHQGQT